MNSSSQTAHFAQCFLVILFSLFPGEDYLDVLSEDSDELLQLESIHFLCCASVFVVVVFVVLVFNFSLCYNEHAFQLAVQALCHFINAGNHDGCEESRYNWIYCCP